MYNFCWNDNAGRKQEIKYFSFAGNNKISLRTKIPTTKTSKKIRGIGALYPKYNNYRIWATHGDTLSTPCLARPCAIELADQTTWQRNQIRRMPQFTKKFHGHHVVVQNECGNQRAANKDIW